MWVTPGIQKCVNIIKTAYPSTVIGNPIGASVTAPTTWTAAENTCVVMSLFTQIAKAAGKDLTATSFADAGYGLRNITIPGYTSPVSFGPNRSYALGPVYLVTFDSQTGQLVIANKSSAS